MDHITAEELIKQLQKVHPTTRVRIFDSPIQEWGVVSTYEGDDNESFCIDIERVRK